ncbi:hypothetical protein QAD02_005456 [Eretmocerus hayati]|uniref:Uncharacterized protein n=1 Tax=Eretmocerus hayati TaxID=131215 RepID=A0ACC2NV59_9HYME|nr:hypothetical protein QAD02_005456 [Eretmocerus hayati]
MSRLQARVLYGLRTDVSGNACYVTDDEVLYLVGNVLSLHNFSQRRQRLVRLPDKQRINLMTVDPTKRYVALCEEGEKPLISVYDLQTLKRKKLLGVPFESSATRFSCASFTLDGKYIAAVTAGGPSPASFNTTQHQQHASGDNTNTGPSAAAFKQTMLFYNWEKGKVESSFEIEPAAVIPGAQAAGASSGGNSGSQVKLISCNPGDVGIMAIAGPYAFKLLTVSETLWRPYGYSKAEALTISSISWLNTDRLFAGTSDGRILYLENGDLKNIFVVAEDSPLCCSSMNLKLREECALQPQNQLEASDGRHEVACLHTFNRGFAFALGFGTLVLFEKESQHKYTKRNLYIVPPQVSSKETPQLYRANSLSSNTSADKLLLTTGWCQLFYAQLWGQDLKTNPEPQLVEPLGNKLHHGPIGGLSGCVWTSKIATFGAEDRSVRIWDYSTETLVMMKQYLEDVSCIVLHPTGLFCLVGFDDKLRFMSILIDDLVPIKEFAVRSCKIAAFSFGGHLFAAVNGNFIEVYDTLDFSVRFVLKGHTEMISGIVWSQDDRKLVSIGSEGAVYEWEMHTGLRSNEVVLKQMALKSVVLAPDGATSYTVSSDKSIYEVKEDVVNRSYAVPGIEPEILVMGNEMSLMFISYPGGFVASLKYPLQDPIEYQDHHVHNANITQMCLTYDEQSLITTDEAGGLCFWRVSYADGADTAMSREQPQLDLILIGRGDLASKVSLMRELGTRLKELESEFAYRMRQAGMQHNDEMRDVHHSYCEAIEQLRDTIDKLEEDHANEINSINVEIARSRAEHEEALRSMEIGYDAKLIVEYDKYQQLEHRSHETRVEYEKRIADIERADRQLLDETISEYENRLREKDQQLKDAHEELSQQVRVHEMIKEQIEDDADREIMDLRTSYEAQLHEERQLNLKLKGEAGVLRNQHAMNQRDTDELKLQLSNSRREYSQLKARKEELDREVAELRAELRERDITIASKDANIHELELARQELEKVRFVLQHRMGELRAQMEPRDAEIAEQRAKINDMEAELLALNRTNESLGLQLTELREKLASSRREAQRELERRKRQQALIRRIRVDILEAASLIHEPSQLGVSVARLYTRYSDDTELQRGHEAELDAQREFSKQRAHMENTIALLKKQLEQATTPGGAVLQQVEKVLGENEELLNELNALRDELSTSRRLIGDMESLLGLKGRDTGPLEARRKLAKICHGNEMVEQDFEARMLECQKVVVLLKDEVDRLISRIPDRNSFST